METTLCANIVHLIPRYDLPVVFIRNLLSLLKQAIIDNLEYESEGRRKGG